MQLLERKCSRRFREEPADCADTQSRVSHSPQIYTRFHVDAYDRLR